LFYQKPAQEVVKEFKTSAEKGLTEKEAQKRLGEFGKNIISRERKKPLILKFLSYFFDIFAFLLLGAAAISFVFGGETGPRDALSRLLRKFFLKKPQC